MKRTVLIKVIGSILSETEVQYTQSELKVESDQLYKIETFLSKFNVNGKHIIPGALIERLKSDIDYPLANYFSMEKAESNPLIYSAIVSIEDL
jgi:ribosome biogenesis SPOUT family RNA methylase Rps3